MKRICKKLIGTAIIAALLGINYGASAMAAEMNHPGMMSSDLRTGLNSLFREHVFLAAWATGAALAGRDGEFKAAEDALDGNSIDIAKAIGSVYGAGAEQAFCRCGANTSALSLTTPSGLQLKTTPRKARPSMISSSTHRISARFSLRRTLICQKRRLPGW